jgi:hypothetical protein
MLFLLRSAYTNLQRALEPETQNSVLTDPSRENDTMKYDATIEAAGLLL